MHIETHLLAITCANKALEIIGKKKMYKSTSRGQHSNLLEAKYCVIKVGESQEQDISENVETNHTGLTLTVQIKAGKIWHPAEPKWSEIILSSAEDFYI